MLGGQEEGWGGGVGRFMRQIWQSFHRSGAIYRLYLSLPCTSVSQRVWMQTLHVKISLIFMTKELKVELIFMNAFARRLVWPLTTKDDSELAHFKCRPLCFLPIRYTIALKLLPCQLTGKRSCIQQRSCQETDTTLDPNERSLQFQKKGLIPEHLSIVNLCL